MKIRDYIFLSVYVVFCSTLFSQEKGLSLTSQKTVFTAGEAIILTFEAATAEAPLLLVSSSYGTTILSPVIAENRLRFKIPPFMANKSGVVYWRMIAATPKLSGQFQITPKQKVHRLETYVGPPSIIAGNQDFTMLVTIPTDDLDNPAGDSIPIVIKEQFLASRPSHSVLTENLIGFKRIFSPLKEGRMLLSTSSKETNSKEFSIDVYPAIPLNFEIKVKRNHAFADGNQITTFFTSRIKDAFNNTIADGTLVTFLITNKSDAILQATGIAINGIATAKMIHPNSSEKWTIKAVIAGIAESNTIKIEYEQAVKDFEVVFAKNNRTVTVGRLQSFMKQKIPDGFPVVLSVYKNNSLLKTINKSSKEGRVSFKLLPAVFKNDNYRLVLQSAGIVKEFNLVKLW